MEYTKLFNEEFLRLGNAFKGLMEILLKFSEWYNNDRKIWELKVFLPIVTSLEQSLPPFSFIDIVWTIDN